MDDVKGRLAAVLEVIEADKGGTLGVMGEDADDDASGILIYKEACWPDEEEEEGG